MGEQIPTAVVSNDPTHWYTVAGTIGLDGVPMKWFVTVAVQISTPPFPFAEPLHCWTLTTGEVETRLVVAQVPAPAMTATRVPTHRVVTTVEGGDAAMDPEAER